MYLGCEFLFTKDDFENHFHEIRTLNNSQYMLMEFYFDCDGEEILEAISHVKERGYIPIIAHPERYEAIQIDEDVAFKAKEMGAYLQMNKASRVIRKFPIILEEIMPMQYLKTMQKIYWG